MDKLHLLWTFIVSHRSEIVWAAVFALIFGVILELLDFRSRIRAGIRHIKNKWSEQSSARLRKRIKELESQRDRYAAYSSSDKALYLATFQLVIGILIFLSAGAGLMVLDKIGISRLLPIPPTIGFLAFVCYTLAATVGIQALKISSLDTRAKVSEVLTKLESEIADLKKKLEAITK